MTRNSLDCLTVETLESRRMMAGDVSAAMSGGDLLLNGDNSGNEVAIRATAQAGEFVVEGLNGTTINGQSSAVINGVVDDFRIDLRGGDNVLLLTAEGPDGEQANLEIADDIQIRTRSGSDVVTFDNVRVGDRTRIDTGDGDDAIVTFQTQLGGEFRVGMGDGNDALGLDSTEVNGRLRVNMGDGDDIFVAFAASFAERSDLTMGSGDDVIGLSQSEFEDDLRVNGGQDDDVLLVDDSTVRGEPRLRNLEVVENADDNQISDVVINSVGLNDAIELIFNEGTGF